MSLTLQLKAALALPPPPGLLPGDLIEGSFDPHRDAAVLIAITDRPDPGVLLTVRRDDMRLHAGQVAFPGGRLDPGEDNVAAALREAWEEIGLSPQAVDLWGAADTYRTITGYAVTPILGVVPPDLDLSPHEHEVAELFEVPLSFLLASSNHQRMSGDYKGMTRHYYQIDWHGRRIWGATAAMIVNLRLRLEAA